MKLTILSMDGNEVAAGLNAPSPGESGDSGVVEVVDVAIQLDECFAELLKIRGCGAAVEGLKVKF